MELRGWIGAVLVGGKDHKILVRVQGDGREGPLGKIGGVVGQMIPVKLHWSGAWIMNLDPVRKVTILILVGGVVHRHEFGNQGSGAQRGRETEQGQDARMSQAQITLDDHESWGGASAADGTSGTETIGAHG